jgi:hypothetical protein
MLSSENNSMKTFLRHYTCHVAQFFTVLLTMALFLLLARSKLPIETYDYPALQFNWTRVDPTHLPVMNSTFGNYNVLLDGHVHTLVSDGNLLPEQVVDLAYLNGYNAIVVSDHNTLMGGKLAQLYAQDKYKDRLIVIPGQEYSTCRIHMNIIGVNQTIKPDKPFPTDQELREVVDRVHRLGGLITVNHVGWSNTTTPPFLEATLPSHPSRETLLQMGVDGIEVVNGKTLDMQSYLFHQRNTDKMFAITGSDLHSMDSAYAWTVLNATEFTEQGILTQLRNRRTSFLLDSGGTRMRAYPDYTQQWTVFGSLLLMGDYFSSFYDENKGMYSFQGSFCQQRMFRVNVGYTAWFVLWCLLIILLVDLVTLGLQTLWKRVYTSRVRK